MLKRKITKIVFVLACIITLIMPYTSSVFAAKLKSTDTTVNLISLDYREGGEEATGTLTEDQRKYYDKSLYEYYIGGETAADRVLKIATKELNPDKVDFSNIFYCVDFSKQFPSEGTGYLEYHKVADMKDSTDANVKSIHLSADQSSDSAKWTANYKALMWLFDNMYLKNVEANQKDEFLQKAFAGSYYDGELLANVKAVLTDDDIEAIQQFAIWYFTNNDYIKTEIVAGEEVDIQKFNVETLPSVHLGKLGEDGLKSYGDIVSPSGVSYGETAINRQEMANILYKYLITSAKAAATSETSDSKVFPTISNDTSLPKKTDENNYVVGPLKITGGNVDSSEYKIYLTDQNNNKLNTSDYKVLIDGETDFTNKSLNEIKDKSVYVYIPKTNTTTTKVTFNLEYNTYKTDATLWKNAENDYQPVVLLDRQPDTKIIPISYDIVRETPKEFDLALRKYIISVNGERVNMAPTVDTSKLKSGEAKTATYKHAKTPVEVSAGDKVVFEIRVYNEGEVDSTRLLITEALPTGLDIVENSQINETYGWTKTGEVSTHKNYTATIDSSIKAYDKENDVLDSKYVQIECKVSDTATAASILTNLAEITDMDKTTDGKTLVDRDSDNGNNDYIFKNLDASNYTGDKDNKTDLTDKDYHYKGLQDDDDFAKIVIKGKSFDLSLKKFITKLNGKALETSREPKVDVSKLKDGTSTDATYTKASSKLSVNKGDLVTYKIRVYNEGDLAGYADEVADYIPEGLAFLTTYKANVDNNWHLPSDAKPVKLTELGVTTSNLKVSDFEGLSKLEDIEVVKGNGKTKITSTLLEAKESKNLIKAFDKEKGTTLDYKDIEVTCIVVADEITNNNGRNIAEITVQKDENKNEVPDRDSTPDTVNPDKYPDTEKRSDGKTYQDDNDYEDLINPKKGNFDLSLQKFITALNNTKITGREPTVSKTTDGKLTFTKNVKDALSVENNDLVTYTIRVYNEGTIAGYAKEIADNIPNGLEFVKDNETNKKYGWKLYDKNGNETSDVNQATTVKTNYLSKSASEAGKYDALLKAFDSSKAASTVSYKDIQIVFKVVESEARKNTGRNIINIAEITNDEDENGNPVDDIDSTPGNNKSGEDDIDQEKLYVKKFDLSLQKYLSKIIIVENGTTREISVKPTDGLQKVEVHRKRINSTTVKFVYDIVVKNEGEISGYAQEITDYIPNGLEFIQEDNKVWSKDSGNKIKTEALANTLLEPGKSATVQVTFKWINGDNNFGLKTNVAEISKDRNDSNTPDIDSVPGNNKSGEDDIDQADVMLGISTGRTPTYLALTFTVLTILSTGIVLIKKYVL